MSSCPARSAGVIAAARRCPQDEVAVGLGVAAAVDGWADGVVVEVLQGAEEVDVVAAAAELRADG